MANPTEIAGDVIGAGTALAGLLLVFLGSAATSFDSYDAVQQDAVRGRYQLRGWLAFSGFVISLISAGLALFGKWFDVKPAADLAPFVLILAFVIALVAAGLAAKDIS
jgi:hypothetical protein